jgi:glucose-6-phosphate 1-dehydrogenase
VLKAIPPLEEKNLVRGQFQGYRNESGVAKDSQTETFAALQLEINSWRWKGVPFYIRAGKCLPMTCTEIVAKFRKPPTLIPDSVLKENHVRLRISPDVVIAMGLMSLAPGEKMELQAGEMVATSIEDAADMGDYERLLGAAMAGDSSLFAREDYVEEAWRIVDSVLKKGTPIYPYASNTWGPDEVSRVTPPGGWEIPVRGADVLSAHG